MLCEKCHAKEATVHLTQEMVGEQAKQRHLCAECFPVGGSAPDEVRAIFREFGVELPKDTEIRDETDPK